MIAGAPSERNGAPTGKERCAYRSEGTTPNKNVGRFCSEKPKERCTQRKKRCAYRSQDPGEGGRGSPDAAGDDAFGSRNPAHARPGDPILSCKTGLFCAETARTVGPRGTGPREVGSRPKNGAPSGKERCAQRKGTVRPTEGMGAPTGKKRCAYRKKTVRLPENLEDNFLQKRLFRSAKILTRMLCM